MDVERCAHGMGVRSHDDDPLRARLFHNHVEPGVLSRRLHAEKRLGQDDTQGTVERAGDVHWLRTAGLHRDVTYTERRQGQKQHNRHDGIVAADGAAR
jgi:hypothetical protein